MRSCSADRSKASPLSAAVHICQPFALTRRCKRYHPAVIVRSSLHLLQPPRADQIPDPKEGEQYDTHPDSQSLLLQPHDCPPAL